MPDLLDRLKAALADRYRVDREICWGGMAHLFLANTLKLDRPAARVNSRLGPSVN